MNRTNVLQLLNLIFQRLRIPINNINKHNIYLKKDFRCTKKY